MDRHFVHSGGQSSSNYLSPYDSYGLRQPRTIYSSGKVIAIEVCESERNLKSCAHIEIWSSYTIEHLKVKIAHLLQINIPSNKFYLEMFDKYTHQWKKLDDSYSTFTIDELNIQPNTRFCIVYHDQSISNDPRSLQSSSPTSQIGGNLWLRLCKKPMDTTDYTLLKISSYFTLGQLREQAYTELNKSSKDQPIYLWTKDEWVKFDPSMDQCILSDLQLEKLAYISLDYVDTSSSSKHPSGLCGLTNLGNTCYMNTVFQCLSNIPEFTQRILALKDSEVNAPITGNYMKLMKTMWSENHKSIEPTALLNKISDNLPRYSTYRQQDAQEFMNHFLHVIHAEFSTKETLITDLFYGQIRSSVKCLQCNQTEATNESISFIPLPISKYHEKTIHYIKTNGEQLFLPISTNSSVISVGDLIDCFLKQYQPTITRGEIEAAGLSDNILRSIFETWRSLGRLGEEELVFLERPKKSYKEEYIICEFFDQSTRKAFRPPIYFIGPDRNCQYIHLSEQIEQVIGHLCSMTGASVSDCHVYWINRSKEQRKLIINTDVEQELTRVEFITIEMSKQWVDIYKEHYNTDNSNSNSKLSGLLSDFFHEAPLDGDYHCLKCSKHTKALQKSDLCLPLPRVLIIQLKRFTYDTYSNSKIDTFISFPLYDLDLNEYIVKDNNDKQEKKSSTKYDLVAVSNHTGSLSGGHYTTYAKNHQDGNWYLFDDRYVRKLDNENDIVTKNAYILVYVQKTK